MNADENQMVMRLIFLNRAMFMFNESIKKMDFDLVLILCVFVRLS